MVLMSPLESLLDDEGRFSLSLMVPLMPLIDIRWTECSIIEHLPINNFLFIDHGERAPGVVPLGIRGKHLDTTRQDHFLAHSQRRYPRLNCRSFHVVSGKNATPFVDATYTIEVLPQMNIGRSERLTV